MKKSKIEFVAEVVELDLTLHCIGGAPKSTWVLSLERYVDGSCLGSVALGTDCRETCEQRARDLVQLGAAARMQVLDLAAVRQRQRERRARILASAERTIASYEAALAEEDIAPERKAWIEPRLADCRQRREDYLAQTAELEAA